VKQLGDATAARANLSVNVTVTGEHRLPGDVQIALHRLTQEALNNVVKHAAARSVEVPLRLAPDSVQLSVVDDGRGFDTSAIPVDGWVWGSCTNEPSR
jgi:signal transduction histidine kinase